MSKLSWLQKVYWKHLAKPTSERELVRFVLSTPVESILEIGMGNGERAARLLDLISKTQARPIQRYVGLDEFEGASDAREHLKLIAAHRLFTERGLKATLFPGTPANSLLRLTHNVQACDLVIIDESWNADNADGQAIAQWLPRLVKTTGTVIARSHVDHAFGLVPFESVIEAQSASPAA